MYFWLTLVAKWKWLISIRPIPRNTEKIAVTAVGFVLCFKKASLYRRIMLRRCFDTIGFFSNISGLKMRYILVALIAQIVLSLRGLDARHDPSAPIAQAAEKVADIICSFLLDISFFHLQF